MSTRASTRPLSFDQAVDALRVAQPGLVRALFLAKEVALALAVSETLVRQLTLSGELPCRRIGRLVRYTQADLDAFVEHCDQRGYSVDSSTK